MSKDRVYLIGFMGVGKTTVAKSYAAKTRCRWEDTDAYIEKRENSTVWEIFAKNGEAYFRDLETTALKETSGKNDIGETMVISCGGGIVLKEENVKYMKEHGEIVYLRAGLETLVSRLQSSEGRPVLQEGKKTLEEKVSQLMHLRSEKYEKAADIIIDTDNLTPEDVVEVLLK